MYLNRDVAPTFQSIILADMHDIKNLKLRIRPEGLHIPISPWNIASPFDVEYVIEIKFWHGNAYNERGEKQLAAYMDYYDVKQAYMLSFCFNENKQPGLRPPVRIGDKTLIEAIV